MLFWHTGKIRHFAFLTYRQVGIPVESGILRRCGGLRAPAGAKRFLFFSKTYNKPLILMKNALNSAF